MFATMMLLRLPKEILLEIAKVLPLSSYKALATTCTSMALLLEDGYLWKQHCKAKWRHLVPEKNSNWILCYQRMMFLMRDFSSTTAEARLRHSSEMVHWNVTVHFLDLFLNVFLRNSGNHEIYYLDPQLQIGDTDDIGPTSLMLSPWEGIMLLKYPYTMTIELVEAKVTLYRDDPYKRPRH